MIHIDRIDSRDGTFMNLTALCGREIKEAYDAEGNILSWAVLEKDKDISDAYRYNNPDDFCTACVLAFFEEANNVP